MKISYEQLLTKTNALNAMSNKELPVKVSYAIAKNVLNIQKELELYDSQRQKLINKYSVKDESGSPVIDIDNNIQIEETNMSDWRRDISELLQIENEIDIIKFNISDLDNYNLTITPSELILIDYMVE